jgi:hypothetical protein
VKHTRSKQGGATSADGPGARQSGSGIVSDTDGQLHEWGSRLFWGTVKGKGGGQGAPLVHAMLATRGGAPSGADIRARIRAVVSPGGKQVMVKITGGGKGMAAIRAHMRYISRLGKEAAGGKGRTLELEDERGNAIQGREGLAGLIDDWRLAGGYVAEDSHRREAFNIILSMPEGTPADAVKDAARAFAQETFEGHKWVMVLHTDTKSPHVHLAVRAERWDGRRLNPRKADLQRWRERFAARLQDRGINALATKARSRGVNRSSQATWRTKAGERVKRPKAPLRAGAGHERGRAEAARAWRGVHEALRQSAAPKDRELAEQVARFVEQAFTGEIGREPMARGPERGGVR